MPAPPPRPPAPKAGPAPHLGPGQRRGRHGPTQEGGREKQQLEALQPGQRHGAPATRKRRRGSQPPKPRLIRRDPRARRRHFRHWALFTQAGGGAGRHASQRQVQRVVRERPAAGRAAGAADHGQLLHVAGGRAGPVRRGEGGLEEAPAAPPPGLPPGNNEAEVGRAARGEAALLEDVAGTGAGPLLPGRPPRSVHARQRPAFGGGGRRGRRRAAAAGALVALRADHGVGRQLRHLPHRVWGGRRLLLVPGRPRSGGRGLTRAKAGGQAVPEEGVQLPVDVR